MGAPSGSSTTVQKTELSPEQRRIMESMESQYMPGGQVTPKPEFDPTNADQWQRGQDLVSPFNDVQKSAFDLAGQYAFNHQGGMSNAQNLTSLAPGAAAAGATTGPLGTGMNLGTGWSTGPNGNATFHRFNQDTMQGYMNPYTSLVTDTGMAELKRTRDLAQRDNNLNAAGSSAFGGTRHALINSETDRNFLDMGQKFLSDSLDRGFTQARDQYNQSYTQGLQGLTHNLQRDTQSAGEMRQGAQMVSDALSNAGKQTADLTKMGHDMDTQGINAIKAVGDAYQTQDQATRETAYNQLMGDYSHGLSVGQAISGFAPPPTQIGNSTGGGGGGALFGSMASGLMSFLPMLFSDERVKENIADADPAEALADIRRLIPKTYDYKAGWDKSVPDGQGKGRRGFLAQDAEQTRSIGVVDTPNGKMVDGQSVLETALHAIHALDREVQSLKGKGRRTKRQEAV